jgi:hypothetical protein
MRTWIHCGLAAGVTLFLIGCGFHLLVPLVAPGISAEFEKNPALFRPWSGWTRSYMAVHPFAYGFVFAAGFLLLRRGAAFIPSIRGGLFYGAGVFVVGSLPVYLLTFASFQVSPEVITFWIVQSLAQYTVAGMIVGCVCDGAKVRVSTVLSADQAKVWKLLLLKDTFLYITRGMMGYTNADQWPTKLFTEGIVLETGIRLFGWGPSLPHTVEVVRVDENQQEIETSESGGVVEAQNEG